MIETIFDVIEILFLALIGMQVLYLALFAVASVFRYRPVLQREGRKNRIVVFIPGYKEDRVIIETAKNALKQSYPRDFYEVVILADSFSRKSIVSLEELDLRLIEVRFDNSTKAKSLNKGLEALAADNPDIAVVLDADNLMETDFLEQVNAAYNSGYKVIQGHRTAKNKETSFALLDAINEEIGNSIFRKGHRVLGLSSGLIGSAMAFDFGYFTELMRDIGDIAGEDKLLELKILKDSERIEYLPNAIVRDEKVSNATTFSKQRTRWVGVQLYFFKHYFLNGVKELFTNGNLGYFDKAYQMAIIPKVLLVALLSILGVLSAFGLLSYLWLAMALFYFGVLLLAVPRKFYNYRLFEAILNIPKAIFYMIRGILKIRRSTASKFEVTEKGSH